ncbi:DNA sulfur modification protein DndB [Clostridium beijerinckii]|uniref:DGQHR domain protein n=1 Tax=Clostridium beijerinckii TaxID=1520 RepID=A0A1S8S497_CLOBE|nr:DNA sulfur modification protein DndB [Clostridium beijerinckii]NRY59533.1 DGQHR domain-containing protein [Clostridium beijerinckii]OOM60288.1 hypothetical protein CLBCK_29870 [Clostridium beijerinckii]
MNNVETIKANPLYQGSYANGIDFNSIKYVMGGRTWIATAIPYSVLGTLIRTTEVKTKDAVISKEVVNRFLDKQHKDDLKKYIVENINSFVIPPITLVSSIDLPFKPITFSSEDLTTKEEIEEALKHHGSLMGRVTLPLGYTFTCLDGNHRTKAIAEISIENPDLIRKDNMLVNIVYETNKIKIRQDFVDINRNAKTTTSTINTLFNSRDPLSKLTSETIDNIEYLNETTELFGASISKNSKKLYTLNNIKNAIVELCGHNSQSTPSIKSFSSNLDKNKEYIEGVKLNIDVFFDMLKENSIIKDFLSQEDKKVEIRNGGLITSGVGLIIVSRVINKAMENNPNEDFINVVKRVLDYNWSRDNDFFVGKILSADKNIISNVTSIKSTADNLFNILFLQPHTNNN